jgi:hypothetical protein
MPELASPFQKRSSGIWLPGSRVRVSLECMPTTVFVLLYNVTYLAKGQSGIPITLQSENESKPAQKCFPSVHKMDEFYNTVVQPVSNRLGSQAGKNTRFQSSRRPHVVRGTEWGGGYNLAGNSPCKSISPLITRIVPNGCYGGTLGT